MNPRIAIAIAADYNGRWVNQVVQDANQAANGVGKAGQRISQSMQAANANVSNLAAQFNDIGVTLASGQSPFLVALQQGSQIGQVLGPMGAGGAVKALGSAFMSLLSPVNLLTIGAIALGGAVVQWLMSIEQEAPSAEDRLKAHDEWLDKILAGYGDARDAAQKYIDEARKLPQAAALDELTNRQTAALQQLDAAFDALIAKQVRIARGDTSGMGTFALQAKQWQQQLESGGMTLDELEQKLKDISRDDALPTYMHKFADEALAAVDNIHAVTVETQSLAAAIGSLSFPALPKGYAEALSTLEGLAKPNLTDRQKAEAARNTGLADAQDAITRLAVEKQYQAAIAQIAAEEAAAKARAAAKGSKTKASTEPLDLMADAIKNTETEAQKLARTVGTTLATATTGLFSTIRKGGDVVGYLADQFGTLADTLLNSALQSLFGSVFGGGFGIGWSQPGRMAGTANLLNVGRFEGGGYTGAGARSGGLDGRGGFMAMLHPDETVIDHRTGGAANSKGGHIAVSVSVGVQNGNLVPLIVQVSGEVAGRKIKQEAPAAVATARRNGTVG